MNIRGVIVSEFDNRPYVPAKIESPYLQNPIEIFFLIDTGASRTMISSYDAIKNNLYQNANLKQNPAGESSGIGGGKINTYILPDCKIIFEYMNKSLRYPLRNLSILYPTNKQGESTPYIKSMLGMDILQFFDILLDNDEVILRYKTRFR